MASFGLKVIRSVFGAAEHVAPRLSGRAAFELFCRTPDVKALSDGERRAVERAAGFMAEARHHRLKTRTGCVAAHEFRPEPGRGSRGTVLVIHGWRSRTEYMRALIEGFRDAGHKVVSLDLPGHGQSLGRHLNMVNAVDAVRVAGEWFGPFVAAVGHSFGGAIAANAVAASVKGIPPLAAGKLVLIAAPSSLPAIFDDFSSMLNVGPRSRIAMADRVKQLSGRPLSEFTGDRQLAETPVPTLVIHAPDDREVHADHAKRYAGAGDHVRLHWAEGLGHRRILADKDVVARAVGFVTGQQELTLQ
ncbi:alpha/beta hydrolase [Mesorhizobium sp. B1-1-8]|uniref:alpha/beta hydrolase n=1 Tax=Mesorhizobium sp. B1-1-8 TaxID=2589976 RepID=UPI00112A938B|nr:alpha/beta hydrolase [Mesorhizobium sp. B1-1-8]UCI05714.1 alpha/beta hydrolase [Mesorhizobium sp. B1-1-8]